MAKKTTEKHRLIAAANYHLWVLKILENPSLGRMESVKVAIDRFVEVAGNFMELTVVQINRRLMALNAKVWKLAQAAKNPKNRESLTSTLHTTCWYSEKLDSLLMAYWLV